MDDIQEYLSAYEGKGEKNLLPVKLLLADFVAIKEKLNIANCEGNVSDLFEADNSFIEEFDCFLRILYGFNVDYFKKFGLKIAFYLVFQIFAMNKY